MGAYRAIISARFRMMLQYRTAAFAGFGTQLFWGLIRVMIFEAFYRSSTAPQPMTWPEMVTYIWLGQALFALLPLGVEFEAMGAIRSGGIAYELLRPLDLYWLWYVRAAAWRLAAATLRAVPMFLIAGLCFGLRPPASLASAGAWALATVGAVLIGCAITALATVSLLWSVSGEGIGQLLPVGVYGLSGILVPLPLFPDWAQRALDFLPFRGLIDIPFRLYMGHLPPTEALPLFAQQLAWTVALVAFGRWLLARGLRRVVVQGG